MLTIILFCKCRCQIKVALCVPPLANQLLETMFGHVRQLAIWNTLWSACSANEKRPTKLDQPCFYNGWRQIGNLFRWWRILIPALQTLVFFQMCMQKLLTSPFLALSSSSLPLIHELRRLGNLIILAKFHLISDKMHFLQKQALIFGGRSSVTQKVSYRQSCQISINF